MMPEPLSTLLGGPEFRAGLSVGIAALVLGVGVGALWRAAGSRRPIPAAGVLVAAGGCVALSIHVAPAPGHLLADPSLPVGLAVGLGLLVGAGLVADVAGWSTGTAALLGVPGALLVAGGAGVVEVGWVRLVVAGTTVVGGWSIASFDRRWAAEGLAPPLLALSAVGVYFTVPDTEEAMVLLGVVAPIAVLGWPLRLFSMGTGGSLAVAALVAWTVAAGGYGRPGSIVGGVACLGLLAVEPVARLAVPAAWPWARARYAPVASMVAHLALVYGSSRVAGLRHKASAALGIAALELVAATTALVTFGRLHGRGHGRRRALARPADTGDRSA